MGEQESVCSGGLWANINSSVLTRTQIYWKLQKKTQLAVTTREC